ncbi:MAG: hypothetical protein JO257_01660, partial [Deltaproteobacteria bacterium]|nr:hypothetical protein [Deltaproteobacteria bacterium]
MRGAIVVGVVMLVGCSSDGGGDSSAVVSASTTYNCLTASAGQGFVSIPVENSTVLETLDYTIQASGTVDAVVGLSAGAPTKFASLAAIARLNSNGHIDARDGSTYRADSSPLYSTNVIPLRIVADITRHRYAVEAQGTEVAGDFQFRTEQASVTHLDHLGVIVDSPTGTVTVC